MFVPQLQLMNRNRNRAAGENQHSAVCGDDILLANQLKNVT